MFRDLHEIAHMFNKLSGHYTSEIEEVCNLSVQADEELEALLGRERHDGLEDNVPKTIVPTEEEARTEREAEEELNEFLDLCDRIGRGFKFIKGLNKKIDEFFDENPEVKEWWSIRNHFNEAQEELKSDIEKLRKLGVNPWCKEEELRELQKDFWSKYRETWLASKKAWESKEGQKATKNLALRKKAWDRLNSLLDEQKEASPVLKAKAAQLKEEVLMPYFTVTGDVHWSQKHLTEYERWYVWDDLMPNRAYEEYRAYKEFWDQERM